MNRRPNAAPVPSMPALRPLHPLHALALSVLLACAAAPGHAADAAGAKASTKPADKLTDKAADKTADKTAAKSPPAGEARAQGRSADPLDQLRERLAEKLGATKPPEAKHNNLLRVSSRLDAPTAAQLGSAAAPRKAQPTVVAAIDPQRADKPAAAAPMAPPAPAPAPRSTQWTYAGDTGPAAWGSLKPEYSLCAKGQRQSPIDIRAGIAVDLDPVQFDYRASGFGVIDNGHTVQVNLAAGNSIVVGGRRYELVHMQFRRPSEERIDGRQFDMSLHLVHRDPEGRTAVVGLLLERGAAQPVVQRVWNNLPLEKGEEQAASSVLDLNHLLPPDRGYYTYMGSMTTPPCSEGVLWMVMRQPVTVSPAQIEVFSRLYPMNARPVQSAAGRMIKQSQ